MQQLLTTQPDAHALLVYCHGWGMNPLAVQELQLPAGLDLLQLWDYRSADRALPKKAYGSYYLVAWSMGVWAAEVYGIAQALVPWRKRIALCGTPYAVDDARGMPEATVRAIRRELTRGSRERFNRIMAGGRGMPGVLRALEATPTIHLLEELQTAQETPLREREDPTPWDLAVIGGKDRVIPPQNQQTYWQGQGVPTLLLPQMGHYPFAGCTSWADCLRLSPTP